MTDENELDGQSRRSFVKKSAAVGAVATTGVAAFGGNTTAQQQDVIQNLSATLNETAGLVNVTATISNVNVVDVLDIRVANNTVTIEDVVSDIDVDVDVSNVANANQVVVQALSSGSVIDTETANIS